MSAGQLLLEQLRQFRQNFSASVGNSEAEFKDPILDLLSRKLGLYIRAQDKFSPRQ
jgi:hypothetical protein